MTIDVRSSLHGIRAGADGLEGHVELEFGHDGQLDLSAKPSGKLLVTASRISSGNPLEDVEMHKRMNVRDFPTIEGVLCDVAGTGELGTYRVSGDIVFRGVSRRQEDHMAIRAVDEATVYLEGGTRLDMRDYGLQPPRVFMLKVDPRFEVRVEIVAVRED